MKLIHNLNGDPPGTPITYAEVSKKYPTSGFTVYRSGDYTNCKLSYIHNIGGLQLLTEEEFKMYLDEVLKTCKGMVFMSTTSVTVKEYLNKLYQVYYCIEVPIGYNNGFQYHIGIRNPINVNAHCRIPVPKSVPPSKEELRKKLTDYLTSKRRKTDIVDDVLNLLK